MYMIYVYTHTHTHTHTHVRVHCSIYQVSGSALQEIHIAGAESSFKVQALQPDFFL